MMKNIIFLLLSIFVLSSCADGYRSYFKRSANNKVIDTKGFKGGKRPPLYNKKYVSLAKKNVADENFDEDLEDDGDDDMYDMNPALLNRQMYAEMLKRDAAKRKKQAKLQKVYEKAANDDEYPSLTEAKEKVAKRPLDQESNLQKELGEIKAMLAETKKELEKTKCPIRAQMDKEDAAKHKSSGKLHAKKKEITKPKDSVALEPVVEQSPSAVLSPAASEQPLPIERESFLKEDVDLVEPVATPPSIRPSSL